MTSVRMGGLLALCLLAAACGREEAAAPVAEGDDTGAKGEVLEGTISDRMITYDELGRDVPLPAPVAVERRATPAAGGGGQNAPEELEIDDAAAEEDAAETEVEEAEPVVEE